MSDPLSPAELERIERRARAYPDVSSPDALSLLAEVRRLSTPPWLDPSGQARPLRDWALRLAGDMGLMATSEEALAEVVESLREFVLQRDHGPVLELRAAFEPATKERAEQKAEVERLRSSTFPAVVTKDMIDAMYKASRALDAFTCDRDEIAELLTSTAVRMDKEQRDG
jgi:hypothetical protein